jgi:hypothetical protein
VPHFAEFRTRLFAAVRQRDAGYVYSVVSPKGTFSFGRDGYGVQGFRRSYHLENTNDIFWTEMEKFLPCGGSWDQQENVVWFPYFYNKPFPGAPERGVHMGGVIMGKDVLIRSGPGKGYSSIDSLSYEVVNCEKSDGDWRLVRYDNQSKIGWVHSRYLAMAFGYRAGFKLTNGRWLLDCFVAGD